MENKIVKKTSKNGVLYTYKIQNNKHIRIPNKTLLQNNYSKDDHKTKKKEGTYYCNIGKDGKLRTFLIKNGKKVRVSNSFATQCRNIDKIQSCEKICKKGKARPDKAPCVLKKTIFTNQKEINEYCSLKVRGEYKLQERKNIAFLENLEMGDSKSIKPKHKKTSKVGFSDFLEEYIEYNNKNEYEYHFSPSRTPKKSVLKNS